MFPAFVPLCAALAGFTALNCVEVFTRGDTLHFSAKKTPGSTELPGVFGIRFRESDYAFE